MDQRYVVRRDFKTRGVWYIKGTVLTEADLDNIKYARVKINEGKIRRIPTDPAELAALCDFFLVKFQVDLEGILAGRVTKAPESAETEQPEVLTTQPGTSEEDVATDATDSTLEDDEHVVKEEPALAAGGIVSTEDLLAIDSGSPETIIPLDSLDPKSKLVLELAKAVEANVVTKSAQAIKAMVK